MSRGAGSLVELLRDPHVASIRVLGFQELSGKNVNLKGITGTGQKKNGKKVQYPWMVHLTQIIEIGPGGRAQPIHQDDGFCLHDFGDELELEVSTMWALTDFTEANGATRVVPGSHVMGGGPKGSHFAL